MIASELGITLVGAGLQGVWPPPPEPRTRVSFSSPGGPFIALVRGDRKRIIDARYGDVEEYDLTRDPAERVNVATEATSDEINEELRGASAPRNFVMPRFVVELTW